MFFNEQWQMIKNFTSRIDHTPLYIGQMSKSNVEVRPISDCVTLW